jgi:hypothetical protein
MFRSDRAEVEAAALAGHGRGYVVLTNHSGVDQSVTVTSRKPLSTTQLIGPEESVPLELHGNRFSVRVPGFGGAVVEYREPAR